MKSSDQERKAAILKGIAHPVRLSIVEALSLGELCVCDIASMFPFDRTTISKHLSLMKSLGILEDRKDGIKVFYSLRLACIGALLSCLEGTVSRAAPEREPKAGKQRLLPVSASIPKEVQ